jgi:hypothetical protein
METFLDIDKSSWRCTAFCSLVVSSVAWLRSTNQSCDVCTHGLSVEERGGGVIGDELEG